MADQKIGFRDWLELQELATSTSSIASFQRMVIPGPVRRAKLNFMVLPDPWEKDVPISRKKKVKSVKLSKFS
jgi:hypothetical protein